MSSQCIPNVLIVLIPCVCVHGRNCNCCNQSPESSLVKRCRPTNQSQQKLVCRASWAGTARYVAKIYYYFFAFCIFNVSHSLLLNSYSFIIVLTYVAYCVYRCFYHCIMYWSIQLQSCQSVYNRLTYLLTYLRWRLTVTVTVMISSVTYNDGSSVSKILPLFFELG